jgi:hypothetical protein
LMVDLSNEPEPYACRIRPAWLALGDQDPLDSFPWASKMRGPRRGEGGVEREVRGCGQGWRDGAGGSVGGLTRVLSPVEWAVLVKRGMADPGRDL